jgi:6-phospho 3-hexuloisomerase
MTGSDAFHRSLDYIEQQIHEILKTVQREDIEKINELFFNAKRIFVYGAGRSGHVSKAFAIRLAHLGFQTFVIGETIGAPVKKGDLVCIVSGSGETIPAVMTAEIAKKLGAKLVVITGMKNARITQFADLAIILSADSPEKERKIYAPLGTLFEASAWIFLDCVIAELMKNKKETEESMRSRHATLELP